MGFDSFCIPLVRAVFAKQLDLESISEKLLTVHFYYIATVIRSGSEDPCLIRRRRVTSSIGACRCKYKSDILNTKSHLIKSTHVSSFSSAGHQVDLYLVLATVSFR